MLAYFLEKVKSSMVHQHPLHDGCAEILPDLDKDKTGEQIIFEQKVLG